jgi:hypothetical protein
MVTQFMVRHGQSLLKTKCTENLHPQALSNALWAVCTKKIVGIIQYIYITQ